MRRPMIAGAIVTALALVVVFGGRVYRWIVDVGQGYAHGPIEHVHVELPLAEGLRSEYRRGRGHDSIIEFVKVCNAGVDGALLLSDRVLEFAVDGVWLVLGKESPKSPLMTAFAADVREEVERGLSSEALAVHEARHVIDAAQLGGLLKPLPCSACDGLSVREVVELSAYTAEFACTDTPATATYQACTAIGSRGGSHRGAIVHLFEQIDADCVLGLPDQSAIRACAKRAFDRDAPIEPPEAFPSRVPLPPRARVGADSPGND